MAYCFFCACVQQHVCLAGGLHAVFQTITEKEAGAAPGTRLRICYRCIADNRAGGIADEFLCQWRYALPYCICATFCVMDQFYCAGLIQSGEKRFSGAPQFHDPEFCANAFGSYIKNMEVFAGQPHRHPPDGPLSPDRMAWMDPEFDRGGDHHLLLFQAKIIGKTNRSVIF